jgi:hypothetical protein
MLMKYDIRLEQHSSRPLAVVRRRAASHELSKVVPDACGVVWNILARVRSQAQVGMSRSIWTARSTWKWESSWTELLPGMAKSFAR